VAERPRLGDLLVAAGAITRTQLGAALADQRSFGQPLGSTLVQMGYLDEETLVRTLARQLKLPVAWLRDKWVEDAVRDLLPAELALKHRVLPLFVTFEDTGKVLHLAMHDPNDLEALDAVGFKVGHKVSPVLAAGSELEDALGRHYAPGARSRRRPSGEGLQPREAPEILTFEKPKSAPVADEMLLTEAVAAMAGTGASAAPSAGRPPAKDGGHLSGEAALAAFLQLVEVFLDNGIVSRKDLAKRLRPYFSD
jgi:type IV pilus assembly protein PilB